MKKTYLILFALIISVINLTDINANTPVEEYNKNAIIALDRNVKVIKMGGEATITPNFGCEKARKQKYKWVSSDPKIVEVVANKDLNAQLITKGKGKAIVTLQQDKNKDVSASCQVIVNGDGVVKILAIGNSFSQDAIEQYLHELAEAEGIPAIVGNMYIGGCSLQTHWKNVQEHGEKYDYRKIHLKGNKTDTPKFTILDALMDEEWDYISTQQVSGNSGIYSTYEKELPLLLDYFKSVATNKDATYILHQTWAYAGDSNHNDFPNYDKDQLKMYNAIVDATRKAGELVNIDIIVPAGTAIQNARTSTLGDKLCRDGYHLDLKVGRYTAACTWFEKLFGVDVRKNTYKPEGVSDGEAMIARQAAHTAVCQPYKVTVMGKCEQGKEYDVKKAA